MPTLAELAAGSRERFWQQRKVPTADVQFSRTSGMDARDITTLRELSTKGLLIILRCPKAAARIWHGLLPPEPGHVSDKTGDFGVAVVPGLGLFVSDYDLMSVWELTPAGYRKVFVGAQGGAKRGAWLPEARVAVRKMNAELVSRIQHGCQDDYHTASNRGVKPDDMFVAFREGRAKLLKSPDAARMYYERNGLAPWPYDSTGRWTSTGAG